MYRGSLHGVCAISGVSFSLFTCLVVFVSCLLFKRMLVLDLDGPKIVSVVYHSVIFQGDIAYMTWEDGLLSLLILRKLSYYHKSDFSIEGLAR